MQNLLDLSKKTKKKVIGLMSGTSLDGVDAALVEISGSGLAAELELLGYLEYPFPNGLKEKILQNSVKESSNVEDICKLNFLIPQIYTAAIKKLCAEVNIPPDEIDLIGSHGQTIQHLPEKENYFGYEIASTLQIGDPAVLAKLTGAVTVGDFRTGDVALGGQGAPLVPYFDFLMFHSDSKNRGLLNIGGISNLTVLRKNGNVDDVLAFDTGPGNMMIDYLVRKFFNKDFDDNGTIASSGKINDELFEALVSMDDFIERKPPKSTGREYYGESFVSSLLNKYKSIEPADWLHTITKFTAYSVHRNYVKFVRDEIKIDELIISGGGARNRFLFECMHGYFGESVKLKVIDDTGINADAKEAICFAVLANETISGNASNIPLTTGASRSTILGKICLP